MICRILRLFVNTYTVDDKYSVLIREYLTQPIHMQLSQKQKTFSQFFSAFFKSRLNFQHVQQKYDSRLMYFRQYGLPKSWLVKYQKSTPSEYTWTSNMVNRPEHCSNLNGDMFIGFIDHYEEN